MEILEKIKEYKEKERKIKVQMDKLKEESIQNCRELRIAYMKDEELKGMIIKDIEDMFGENPTLNKAKQTKLWNYFKSKKDILITSNPYKVSTNDCLNLLGIRHSYSELPMEDGWKELSIVTKRPDVSGVLTEEEKKNIYYSTEDSDMYE